MRCTITVDPVSERGIFAQIITRAPKEPYLPESLAVEVIEYVEQSIDGEPPRLGHAIQITAAPTDHWGRSMLPAVYPVYLAAQRLREWATEDRP